MGLINLVKERNRKRRKWEILHLRVMCSNNKSSKFTNEDRQLIHQHINSIPRDVSHYSRAKSDKQFLSPDLNIHRLYKSFLQKNKTSTVSYKFYRGVFKKDFPNLSFHRPRVDTCHTCDRLSCESKSE
nr:unnamed protein product [Callosobruchus analis]